MRFEGDAFYLKTAAEMQRLFPDQREALLNTRRVAEMVDLALPLGELRIPHFPVPDGETVETWLRKECEAGLVRRYGAITPELQQRLDYELGVIISMGYAGYFLIVADFVRFAREQGIATTCRGSAPGSIVTYTLGITPVDPIHYGLPFERFLNPDRVTMPDIDVDFEDERRDEVINYVSRKYGQDHVAQIITFGTMLARAAIRDVGRVMGMGYGEVDRIAKAVPNQLGIKLSEALELSPQLKEMHDGDPQVAQADRPRPAARGRRAQRVHARRRRRDQPRAADRADAAPEGDQLGRADDPVRDARHRGAGPAEVRLPGPVQPHDPAQGRGPDPRAPRRGRWTSSGIPLDDAKTFELLASGETTGVFQLESAGMRRYIRELQPTSVFDLAAMVALYRPGPMDNIPAYIRRKHGQEKVEYLHPLLEPFLNRTYGIFVYQEDIMSAAIALGGFSGPEADTLGYAIRKKKSGGPAVDEGEVRQQAAERGVAPQTIDAVFKAFEPFERYGFNKAHATCYGLIAYQTAYLKANYTVEYMTSVLTAFRDNAEKVAAAIAECRRLGIEVRPPDVHRSGLGFTVEGEAIRFGLLAVKNVGEGAIESIIDARTDGGEFRSLTDFCSRVDLRLANRKVLESLIRVGALNAFGHPAQLLLGLDDALAAGQATQRDRVSGQTSLFDMGADDAAALERPLPATPETPVRERLRWEKELMGLYLSDHPMGEVAERVGLFVTAYTGDLKDESLDGQRVVLGGIVTGQRTILTKSKSTMAVVTIEDLQGTVEIVVFPKTYEQTMGMWRDGAILLVAGRVDHRGDEASLLADSVWDWDAVAERGPEAFAREVGALDKRAAGGVDRAGRPAARATEATGTAATASRREPVGAGPGTAASFVRPASGPTAQPSISPVRAEASLPRVAPGEPMATYAEPPDLAGAAGTDEPDEPALPDEARSRAAAAAQAPSRPLEASADAVLNVRFAREAGTERVVSAMQAFKSVLRDRPGATRVVVHVPAPGGSALPMELRGVAWDTGARGRGAAPSWRRRHRALARLIRGERP